MVSSFVFFFMFLTIFSVKVEGKFLAYLTTCWGVVKDSFFHSKKEYALIFFSKFF